MASIASAVDDYQKCLKCFHENRVGFFFCEQSSICYPNDSWQCAEEDKIVNFADCPRKIENKRCGNYTFTSNDFEREDIVDKNFKLNEGVGCWMKIDRAFDGSYGTATLKFDNPYLMVFDEFDFDYKSGDTLGLIEESTYLGWK